MFPSGTEMCLLARLVLPSEGVVSAGELGGVRGQGCGARAAGPGREWGRVCGQGWEPRAHQAVSRVRHLLAESAACWYICSGKPPGSLETENHEPSVRLVGFVL